MSKQINALTRIKNDLDIISRRALYNSYIVSHLNYCATVWMFTSRTNLNKLNKLNKRALRAVYKRALRAVYNDKSCYALLLARNKSLDVHKSCLLMLAIEMYKAKNGTLPIYIKELFIHKEQPYFLRDNDIYVLPAFNTITFGYHCMRYIGAKLWGNIDTKIKNLTCINSFKKQVKLWLADKNNVVDIYF